MDLLLGEFGIVYKAHYVKTMQAMPTFVAVKTLKGKHFSNVITCTLDQIVNSLRCEECSQIGLLNQETKKLKYKFMEMAFLGLVTCETEYDYQ